MKPAHTATLASHDRVRRELDFSDRQDFDDARRGFIATLPDAHIERDSGGVAWSQRPYGFLNGEAQDTVNPSLWRMAQLNREHGLFQVTDRIYQVRGFSLANVTFIEGEKGIIVIDPLQFTEHARAALALYREHRGDRPVSAVVYTHSHRDHYGGVRGVIGPDDLARGVPVWAPHGFTEESFSESMLAGVPMRRRAMFQFGWGLPPGPMAHVDSGLGKAVGGGHDGFIAPTHLVREPLERHLIDGVEVVFQLTPGTEAPADMNLHFPGLRALNLAENACHTMHNLCPLRGAKTRDALAWSKYLDDALDSFVPEADVLVVQHHWPVWNTPSQPRRIAEYVAGQRDLYRYLHDQTLRLMSHGLTPTEIAAELMLPNALSKQWFARGYYGAVTHNVHAIYAHYLGPYEGNPAHLDRLPPVPAAQKYVQYMGGADAVLARARADFEAGEFRWVVEVLNQVVFADPSNKPARQLCADAMEQLGYQAESATWRNAYLLGARELRVSGDDTGKPVNLPISPDVLAILPLDSFLDYLAIRLNGPRAQNLGVRIDWLLEDATDPQEQRITLTHGTLAHRPGRHHEPSDVVVRTTRQELAAISSGRNAMARALNDGSLRIEGERGAFQALVDALDDFDPMFHVIEP